jgi:hypothetical protein
MKDSIYYALDLVSNFASTYSPAPCEITAVTAVTVVIWFSILYSISTIYPRKVIFRAANQRAKVKFE